MKETIEDILKATRKTLLVAVSITSLIVGVIAENKIDLLPDQQFSTAGAKTVSFQEDHYIADELDEIGDRANSLLLRIHLTDDNIECYNIAKGLQAVADGAQSAEDRLNEHKNPYREKEEYRRLRDQLKYLSEKAIDINCL